MREYEHLRYVPLVLLTPESDPVLNCEQSHFPRRGQTLTTQAAVKWCLDLSISAQVTTPVTPNDMMNALIAALESNTVTPAVAEQNVVYRILIAEDNQVNQKLAVKILEKYGHLVEIAENGALAVDAFKQRVAQGRLFDIILVRPPV